jgi:hypothetical protein
MNFLNSVEKFISKFMLMRPVAAELFHTDRRTDMTKLLVSFRNFENAPKNLYICTSIITTHLWHSAQLNIGTNSPFYHTMIQLVIVIVGFVNQLIWDCTKSINRFRNKSYHINANLEEKSIEKIHFVRVQYVLIKKTYL